MPSALGWLLVLGALFLLFELFTSQNGSGRHAIPYSAFKEQVRQGHVKAVTLVGNTIRVELDRARNIADVGSVEHFKTIRPPVEDPGLMPLLEKQDVKIGASPPQRGWLQAMSIALLPWLLLLALFVYLGRRFRQQAGQGAAHDVFGMGKSRARRFKKTKVSTTFEDVAGLSSAKAELQEVVDFLKNPGPYRELGAAVPRGTLLMGPPGTGKTLLARAVAGEADVPFFSIGGSEFIEMFVGVGAARVRDLFKEAKRAAPSIVYIDEVDSIGRARGTGLGGGHDEREQTLNQILAEMDGFEPSEAVMVLAGTNRPDVLDSALMRPGRFDRKLVLDLPRRDARRQILEVHVRQMKLEPTLNLDSIAETTIGFSGADLKNLANEAAMLAARRGATSIAQADFELARDKILMGPERDEALGPEERERVAHHEAGHALVAALTPRADALRKVTILPRGHALGATEQMPREERNNISQSELEARLAVLMGGRGAEQLVYGELTSGAAEDLKQATRLARKMVTQLGMSKRLGASSFRYGEEHVFLGKEMAAQRRDFSEYTARLIDEEVLRIVTEAEERAARCLAAHQEELEALARTLMAHETIDAETVGQVLRTRHAAE